MKKFVLLLITLLTLFALAQTRYVEEESLEGEPIYEISTLAEKEDIQAIQSVTMQDNTNMKSTKENYKKKREKKKKEE